MYGYEILHEQTAENLIENVRNGKAQHAYIFEGEKGVGYMETARLFANALVCKDSSAAPCGVCSACIMAKALTHPDICFIKPKPDKKNITVDQIRQLAAGAYTKPYESMKKVYIIDSGDDMNEQAQNALLKILEEPPDYAVFIILSENHETLLQTIRSRCALIHFNPVSEEKVKEYLMSRFPEEKERLDFLARYSHGVVQKAEKIIAQENFMTIRKDSFDIFHKLLSQNMSEAYDIADFLEENKSDADVILQFWLDLARDIMLVQNGAENLVINSDFLTVMQYASQENDEKQIVFASEQLLLAQKMRKRYVSLRALALRLAFTIKLNGVRNR